MDRKENVGRAPPGGRVVDREREGPPAPPPGPPPGTSGDASDGVFDAGRIRRRVIRHMPATRAGRLALGGGLVLGGILGFLPVLGFWMVPLGLFVLAQDFPVARRLNRRMTVAVERRRRQWIERWRRRRDAGANGR